MATLSTAPSTRVAHLLAVAQAEFSAHGYDHVSIDGIARAASVSKETIYRHFTDKRALFEAAIESLRAEFSMRVAETAGSDTVADEEAVARIVRLIYDSANVGGYLSATWLSVASMRFFPDLAERLHDEGLRRIEPIRAALAARAAALGIAGDVLPAHAGDLGAMAVEGTRTIMGWPPLEGAERDAHARAVAHLFLHGCATDAPSPPLAPSFPAPEQGAAPLPPPAPRADHIALLMATARRHFDAHGYRGASLDAIGVEARVGRGTLYRHFDGKAGLFEAVMLDEAHAVAAELAATLPALAPNEEPAVVLSGFAAAAGAVLAGPRSVALHRIVIAEARRAPRLARQVHAATRLPAMLPLTDYLAAGAVTGRFRLNDADWHARQFLTLAGEGNRPLTRRAQASPDERARTARRAVATFLSGYTAALG